MKKTDTQPATTTVVEAPSVPTEVLEQAMTVEEARVLRMRSGATVSANAPLGSKLDGLDAEAQADVATRLALIEAELFARIPEAADAARTRRIVEALKAKGTPTEG